MTEHHHREVLARFGWTAEEYEDGMKHSTQTFTREAAGAFRCAGLWVGGLGCGGEMEGGVDECVFGCCVWGCRLVV